jgi:hypothetical protein
MPTKGDRDFGEMAVKHKFVEPQEIEKALREQKRLEKEGALLTLDRVVIEMGFMNPFQVEFIQERLNRKVIYCPGCMTKYNVFKYRGDTRVKCRKCSESIEVPKRFSEMEPEERKARADAGKPIYETKAFLGKVVGGYKVIEELGSGEMGVVFKARQLSLDRVVALKVLPAEVTRDKDSVDRFLREAKSAGKLQHPNIVQVYDIGETGGLYYYSMEFIEGKSLASILPPEKAMDLGEALRIVHQIAKALSHAHRYGVLHKDICPECLRCVRRLFTRGHLLPHGHGAGTLHRAEHPRRHEGDPGGHPPRGQRTEFEHSQGALRSDRPDDGPGRCGSHPLGGGTRGSAELAEQRDREQSAQETGSEIQPAVEPRKKAEEG